LAEWQLARFLDIRQFPPILTTRWFTRRRIAARSSFPCRTPISGALAVAAKKRPSTRAKPVMAAGPLTSSLDRSSHCTLTMNGGRGASQRSPFVDPHAITDIRRRAQNHVIARLQSCTDIDAGAIVQVEIDLPKFDLPLGNDTDL
jgi:hypothetical protein